MSSEIDIYGVFFPGLLVWTVVAMVLTALFWQKPLFDLALLVIVLGGFVTVQRILP